VPSGAFHIISFWCPREGQQREIIANAAEPVDFGAFTTDLHLPEAIVAEMFKRINFSLMA
jgi:hypothetical protein